MTPGTLRKQYDLVIIGAGPGGYVAAIRAAQLGMSVGVVEERELGGTCLNRGCIPTKALLESVHVLSLARRADEFGVKVGEVAPDIQKMYARKDAVCDRLRRGIEGLLKKHGIHWVVGRGSLEDRNRVAVVSEGQRQGPAAKKIIIATGSEPLKLPMFPCDGENIITSDDALCLERAPASMIIIGGGAIGCEWAGIFSKLGVKVTIVEMMDQLLPLTDAEVAKEMFKVFRKAKVGVKLKTKVESLDLTEDGVKARLSDGKEIVVQKVMVCVGRALNSKDIGLDKAGVALDRHAIRVNEHCCTNVPNIYAIGDVTGKWLLAHYASRQGQVAVEHAAGREFTLNENVVPSCIFTHPEIGAVGLTSKQAEEAGHKVREARFNFMASGRAQAMGETEGFVKIVGDADTGEVLGVHIIGPHATDLIAEAALAMQLECTVEEIARTIHAHPTLAEAMMEAGEIWMGQAIHA